MYFRYIFPETRIFYNADGEEDDANSGTTSTGEADGITQTATDGTTDTTTDTTTLTYSDGKTITYTYDAEGRIISEATGNCNIYGCGVDYVKTYEYNGFNEISFECIKYIEEDGYDTWGMELWYDAVCGYEDIAEINCIRYRSYYYNSETCLYYLQSRYYDPYTGGFINADDTDYLGVSDTVFAYNAFAYCENDPVNCSDPSGHATVGAIIGGILGFGLGALLVPRVADLLKLKGWKRSVFVVLGVAALTGLGAYIGYYIGNVITAIYRAGGALAKKVNEALTKGIAKVVCGSAKSAKGNGWIIKVGKFTLRIMTSGGGKTNYFRLSQEGKGTYAITGILSSNRAKTHISITYSNIIKIVKLILKLKK